MENYIDIGQGNIWTCINGKADGPVVLLCNGGPGCCDYLALVSEMLEQDYFVIRFKQRGCGRSVCDGKYNLETAIADIETIRKFYKVSNWVVAGHSWGANLALVYGLIYPEHVSSIIYIAGNGIHNDRHWSQEYHTKKDTLGEIAPDMDYVFNNEVNILGNATLRAFGRKPDFYKKVAELKITTLFVMPENDIRPSWPVEQLYQLMPNARYVCIPNAEHYIWLRNPEGLKAELLGFMREILG